MQSLYTLLATDNIPFNNICDSGASDCAFNLMHFFPQGFNEHLLDLYLGRIANRLTVEGTGTATITLQTQSSTFICILIPHSLYVPDLPCNLLLPQWLIAELQKQHKKSSFHIFPNG